MGIGKYLGPLAGFVGGALTGAIPGRALGAFGGLTGMGASGMSPMGLLAGGMGGLLGGNKKGYQSSDGLVNIPDLSPEDALNGFRSVIDFRHIYGPDTKVPNINFGGQIVSGKLPDSALDNPQPNAAVPSPMALKRPGMFGAGFNPQSVFQMRPMFNGGF